MCGIAGELNWREGPDRAAVAAMTGRLVHRGPDGSGLVVRGPVCLGHRRLEVIDPTEASDQPLADRSRKLWITYNGEIYNFRELRRELEEDGARFASRGDTEVVVLAFERWGLDALDRLDGMFAFALWDEERRRLILARDRLGEKPLHYARIPGGGLVFASTLDAVLAHPRLSLEVDPGSLGRYLSLNYTLGEETIVRGIRRLPPASFLVAEPGEAPRIRRYWDLARCFREKSRVTGLAEASEELRPILHRAVSSRMVADVPLGAFLSGGLDSSAVVEGMSRAGPREAVRAFSIGFGEHSFSELPKARKVASHLGIRLDEGIVTARMARDLPGIVQALGEPLADSSMVPFYFLARFAREQVTVCLSGDGGDEIFAGYDTYTANRLHAALGWLPGPLTRLAAAAADRLLPVTFGKVSFEEKLRRFLPALALDRRRAHHHWRTIFSARGKRRLLRPEITGQVAEEDGFDVFADHFSEVADCHALDQAMYVDTKTWLVDDILVKVDRTTMAHSLESRAPFLARELVELAASLPAEIKMRGLEKKVLLRRALAGSLPREVVAQPKRGFNAPVSSWFAGELAALSREVVQGGPLSDWLRPEAVDTLFSEHSSGQRDHGLRLFGLTCLGLWMTGARDAVTHRVTPTVVTGASG